MNRLDSYVCSASAAPRRLRQDVDSTPVELSLPARLAHCANVLEETYRQLVRLSSDRGVISPAAKRFLDQHSLIREQIQGVRQDLCGGYEKRLPKAGGAEKDANGALPRVYLLARELVAGANHGLDADRVRAFVSAYQSRRVLTLAELWGLSPMLRLSLIEKLAEQVEGIAVGRRSREPTNHRGTVDEDFKGESDKDAVDVTIASLRTLKLVDWKALVESTSVVERVLRRDPASVYKKMTFASRSYYRKAVAALAQGSSLTEEQVAESAVECARECALPLAPPGPAADSPGETVERHVGFYLCGRGRPTLEARIGYRPAWTETVRRYIARWAARFYFGGLLLVWLLALSLATAVGWRMGVPRIAGPAGGLALFLLAAGSLGHFAVTVVDWLSTLFVPPKPIVRLDFSAGIPSDHSSLVVVPTMLADEQGVSSLLHQIELRFLGNQDRNLSFALVTDFPDADRENTPGDSKILSAARQGIERLNRRHGDVFYLLHRPRSWNAQEGVWMGSERKRGKLAALNHLLRSGDAAAFQLTVGDLARLARVRYVITLDTDTRLPRNVARELVGCIAHPLNRPRIDPITRVVTEGHAVLQPRVTATLVDARRSPFSRLLAGDAGIDPYTHQTSQVYQDVFEEGSFIGKGIYDVRAWDSALAGRFPDNRVLSHDLIEGCFARSGFVGDVELFESVPSRVLSDASRRHRWIRGDWQIAAWLFPHAPAAQGRAKNPLSWLSRWKIADNLRRSLTPVFLFAMLTVGWLLSPPAAVFWTLLAAIIMFGPAAFSAAVCFVRKVEGTPWRLHAADETKTCFRALATEAVSLCTLPYIAHFHIDAVIRSLYRLYVSHRRLLEWTTASDAEARSRTSCRDHYERMWACTIASVGMAALLAIVQPSTLWSAGPVLLAWLLGPTIAWLISQPARDESAELREEQRLLLGRWARQTWHYFETQVNRRTHWLPPDNVQENLRPTVVTRTSPTNIGMALLANLAAHDLGYVATSAMLLRSVRTLHSMLRLKQYRGHFYNWYDSRTLEPVEPRYVSSVDSGNLWAALIVLHAGAEELRDRAVAPPRLVEGIRETLAVIASLSDSLRRSSLGIRFDKRFTAFQALCDRATGHQASELEKTIRRLRRRAAEMAAAAPPGLPELRKWTRAMVRQCGAAHRDLCRHAFWRHFPVHWAGRRVRGAPVGNPALSSRQGSVLARLCGTIEELDEHCTLSQVPAAATRAVEDAESLLRPESRSGNSEGPLPPKLDAALRRIVSRARRAAAVALAELRQIARVQDLCRQFCAMDFRFLYDTRRKLLAIGYNASRRRRDEGYYDLLASESRMTSFLAVSHGQLPLDHWFALGRIVTLVQGGPALVSWSGSMFEHLMPMLVMPSYQGTFLDLSCRAAVRRQMEYARRLGIPWGISESSYHAFNDDDAYGYRAFGVPGLGLERGLAENLVVAPYASALALTISPQEAVANLEVLERLGCLGPYGFYDAIDYTPGRDAEGGPALCRIVMAHHSGMTLLALVNSLLGRVMEQRIMADGCCAAHDLLLQERLPKSIRPVAAEETDVTAPAWETRARRPAGPNPNSGGQRTDSGASRPASNSPVG